MQVLFFFFSRGDISGASAYFKIIEKEAEESKSVVEPALAEMYLSHMLQLEDPSEALLTLNRLEEQYSLTNRTLLLDSSLGSDGRDRAGGSGDNLKVGALLYAKVVNVLLRTNKTADAKALIPLLEARNLTRKRDHTAPHLIPSPSPPLPPYRLSVTSVVLSCLHSTAQH